MDTRPLAHFSVCLPSFTGCSPLNLLLPSPFITLKRERMAQLLTYKARRSGGTKPVQNGGLVGNGVSTHLQSPSLPGGGESETDEPLIESLPLDILLKVFSFLDVISLCRCAQVSKKWHELALDGSNWQHVDFFDFQVDIEEQVVDRLSRRCGGFLRSLSLKGCEGVEDSAIKTFSTHCPYIETLILHKCYRVSDTAVQSLSQHCNKLVRLDLSSCRGISDKSCTYLAAGCKDLAYIDLSYCAITYKGVISLVEGCGQLSGLSLQYCGELTDEALKHVGSHCPKLKRLNIQACRRVSDIGIEAICEGCQLLERINMSHIDQLTDQSLRKLSLCSQLKDVEAAGCSNFTDAGFIALANGCSGLTRMDLEECILVTDATLVKLGANCPNLESLVLSHCERISDSGINQLLDSPCGEILQVLELDNCPQITDNTLEKLRTCNTLKRVEVFDCQLLSRMAIQKLQHTRPDITVHAYFPPHPPQAPPPQSRRRVTCQCCSLL
ncbi:PREDICTED: F-box/LRR-repeat protein 2-like [Amphimedon queenslandica]|uniref:F-box domain-containing protein n=1 Tax=Amphimedon queenslandica TaxID=400682 RepID=A0A1X7UIH6_AMPQE|nr:PREDICTED: F-box/LRR-repeat protein 2-like [Amphimedon queenslandica]|eukprot:XP_003387849.2 PREDICTED: F-box/LRR-repeat protein 2-like [Amphimedon queenslandica]